MPMWLKWKENDWCDYIVCPYCGMIPDEPMYTALGSLAVVQECPECEKKFGVEEKTTYCTSKRD